MQCDGRWVICRYVFLHLHLHCAPLIAIADCYELDSSAISSVGHCYLSMQIQALFSRAAQLSRWQKKIFTNSLLTLRILYNLRYVCD